MANFAGHTALWRHMQASHHFNHWTEADVLDAYEGESLEDIHQRDHAPASGIGHEHRIGTSLAPQSTIAP